MDKDMNTMDMDNENDYSSIFYNPHLSELENRKLLKILVDDDISPENWNEYKKMSREEYANLVRNALEEGNKVEDEYIKEYLQSSNKYGGGKRKSKRRKSKNKKI